MGDDATGHQELRIHGVSGTPPRDILYTDPDQVTTADTSIYKRREYDPCFETRAFHWASLTSGSRVTALWLLLAPFAFANAAGWMSGWRRHPTQAADPPNRKAFHAQFGRFAVRSAGIGLTLLFVAQEITAMVFLPVTWISGTQPVKIFFITIKPPGWGEKTSLIVFAAAVTVFVLVLVLLSALSHFKQVEKEQKSPRSLLFGGKRESMVNAHESYEGQDQFVLSDKDRSDDPGGAQIAEASLWTIHPILHRLRRIHLGMGFGLIAIYLAMTTGLLSLDWALAILLALVAIYSGLTTFAAPTGVSWGLTIALPWAGILSIGFVIGYLIGFQGELVLDGIHDLTLGVSLILGVFSLLALFAGPLSVGALSLGTFVGAALGASAGLALEQLMGIDVLLNQGVGWVAVAMLGFLILLLGVALVLAFVGHKEERLGNTSPLPPLTFLRAVRQLIPLAKSKEPTRVDLGKRYWLMVGRRVELQARHIFHAAAIFGLLAFTYVGSAIWAGTGDLVERVQPSALPIPPPGLVGVAVAAVVVPIGLFAYRSIRKGWGGGDSGEGQRRQVGILWDLGSFWPRWYHPLAPPGYGPRAVQDLTAALTADAKPAILGAHSQGSLIAAVAIDKSGRADLNFVTYGSQLGILYPRMFPNAGIPELSMAIAARDPGEWVNLWRNTDPIGGHYVDVSGVTNRPCVEGKGHSGHEDTDDYRRIRRELIGLSDNDLCGAPSEEE